MATPEILRCRSCNQPIFFAVSPQGRRIPLDASSLVYELTGKELDGLPAVRVRTGPDGNSRVAWVSHFRTCKHPEPFSGRSTKPASSAREGACPPSTSPPAS